MNPLAIPQKPPIRLANLQLDKRIYLLEDELGAEDFREGPLTPPLTKDHSRSVALQEIRKAKRNPNGYNRLRMWKPILKVELS
jgi:hypothetical protein